MSFSSEWLAVGREAGLAAELLASGVTALGKANHAQKAYYNQAFFNISIGLERIGKLIFIANHAILNDGLFPSNAELRRIGHNITDLLAKAEEIEENSRSFLSLEYARPNNLIHINIVNVINEFATRSRYYNLDFISGSSRSQHKDPIQAWWTDVGSPILELHYSEKQREKDNRSASKVADLMQNSFVLHHAEDQSEINDAYGYFRQAGSTRVVQKYGRFYTLQIIRWLAVLISALSTYGAYTKRIEPLLGLDEVFMIFRADDCFFRTRKTWSIYKP